jgi:hypothetical protein
MLNMFPKLELVPISRYFVTLPNARRPSEDAVVQNLQALLEEDDVGCVARYVHRGSDRDPHIRRVE